MQIQEQIQKRRAKGLRNQLITLSSMHLRSVEMKFAVDSSGFRTSRYSQYIKVKYDMKEHKEGEVSADKAYSSKYMLKTRFNDYIRSKNQTAQINELLLKVLCHNICVLVSEMFELNILINFSKD